MRARTPIALLLTILAAASSVAAATPAGAAGRLLFAKPGGAGDACTTVDPCNIDHAWADAVTGDTIKLAGGTYTNGGSPFSSAIQPGSGVTGVAVVDRGPSIPVVESNAGAGVVLGSGWTLRGLAVKYGGPNSGIEITGTGAAGPAVASRVIVADSGDGVSCDVEGTLADSLCVNSGGGIAAGSDGYTDTVTPVLRGVTAEATGSGSVGLGYSAGAGGVAHVTVTNSIAHGAAGDVLAQTGDHNGVSSITLDHSDFSVASAVGNPGSATVTSGAGNISAAPRFVDAAHGDYRERTGSRTINAGAKDPSSETDLLGRSRAIGGRPDMGAYERTIPPRLSTPRVTAGKHTALVRLTCNPEGLPGTIRFRATIVKPPKGFKGKKTLTTKAQALPALAKPIRVSITLSGLAAKTKYSVVVIAHNAAGTTTSKPIKITTTA